MSVTRADDRRPVRRVVSDGNGSHYIVELGAHALRIRPLGAQREGPAAFARSFRQIYYDAAAGGPLGPTPRKGKR